MEKIIVSCIFLSFLFLVIKFIEKKILKKHADDQADEDENGTLSDQVSSMKDVFRDAILIFICALITLVGFEQLWPLLQNTFSGLATGDIIDVGPPKVFGGQPEF
jgi:hypothetical protein